MVNYSVLSVCCFEGKLLSSFTISPRLWPNPFSKRCINLFKSHDYVELLKLPAKQSTLSRFAIILKYSNRFSTAPEHKSRILASSLRPAGAASNRTTKSVKFQLSKFSR